MKKTCKRCGESKTLDDFYSHPSTKDGRRGSCKACEIARVKVWQLKTYYGITKEQFDAMFAAQDGKCGICGTDKPGGKRGALCVDHDHTTGTARGLLCTTCNSALGKFGDSIEGVTKVMRYLEMTQ